MRECNLVQNMTLPLPTVLLLWCQVPLHHHFYERFPKYYFIFVSFPLLYFYTFQSCFFMVP